MIKIIDNKLEFNGTKEVILAELELTTEYVVKELKFIDKLVLLHEITNIINDSIEEDTTDE